MARGFRPVDRETAFLMPPDMREWLPEDHLAWTVIDAVEALDLSALIAGYRLGGRGRQAYDPAMMLTLLIYAYSQGVTSSRRIEAGCAHDVAFRVITGHQRPDHDTIAAFRARHREPIAGLFTQVLRLCREAGLVRVGVIAVDGTKMRANAAKSANRRGEHIDTELHTTTATAGPGSGPGSGSGSGDGAGAVVEALLAAAEGVDAAEDAQFGAGRRGDEPPAGMARAGSRRANLLAAKQRLAERDAAARAAREQEQAEFQAKQDAYQAQRAAPGPNPMGRPPVDPAQRRSSNTTRDAARGDLRVNTTDPDSRLMRVRGGFVQGYNAQAVVSDDQIIIATDVVTDGNDTAQLPPMTHAALRALHAAGIETPGCVLADAGYWNTHAVVGLEAAHHDGRGPRPLVPPDRAALRPEPGDHDPRRQSAPAKQMRDRLRGSEDRQRYQRRGVTVEPVFGQIKTMLGDRFRSRGHTAVRAEFTLIALVHNLRKLHTATATTATA